VFSHYHGDHVPLADANPYQLSLSRIPALHHTRFWCRGSDYLSFKSLRRREAMETTLPGHSPRQKAPLTDSSPSRHLSPTVHHDPTLGG
jgi:hypothetical protein